MKKVLLSICVVIFLLFCYATCVYADTEEKNALDETVILDKEQYNIDGKIVVFTLYKKSDIVAEVVNVYEDSLKQVKSKVSNELANKIEEISKSRTHIAERYLGNTAMLRVTGEELSASKAGDGTVYDRNTYAGHYTLHSSSPFENGYKHTFYNGYSRVVYGGNQILSYMAVKSDILITSELNAFLYPDEYSNIIGTQSFSFDDEWYENYYMCTLYRSNLNSYSVSETAKTFNITTSATVRYGNIEAKATVTSNW